MNKDLTTGDPQKVLWAFCLPLFGSVIFQQLYNIADSLVAGKFAGETALAAVGNSYEITLIFIAFAFGCNIGCSVVVSQLFGAKEYGAMKTAVTTTLISCGVLCALLMAFGFGLGGTLLSLINTPEEIMADSALYLRIYVLGLPFLFFYNVSTGIFSAMGDSKTPFYFLAISSVTNILVDIWFVAGLGWGVAGVAWATFLCQGISCLLAVTVVLSRLKKIETSQSHPLFSWDMFRRIAAIAVPSICQQSFVSVGNILIQSVINGFGSGVIAGYAAAIKLNNLVITSLTTLGNGVSNFAAQNLGAGKQERIGKGMWAGFGMVWTLCVPIVALYLIAGRYLLFLFMDDGTGLAMTTGLQFLHIVSGFYFVVSLKLVSDGILRGMGRMNAFMTATFLDLILRVSLAFVLSKSFGALGIWMAWPIGWSTATALSLFFNRRYFVRTASTN